MTEKKKREKSEEHAENETEDSFRYTERNRYCIRVKADRRGIE